MLITAVEPRRKSLRALYLDDEFAANVDAQTIEDAGYRVGMQMDDEQLHELLCRSESHRAHEKALYLLAHRDHSKKELADKLRRTASDETARATAQRMEEIGLVDDESYARRYALELMRRKGYSASRTEYELVQKGIDRELIREIIEETAPDVSQQLAGLLQSKYAKAVQDEKGRRRTVAALQRLGYRWEDVRRALEEFVPAWGDKDD